jgi:hypothetical protein
MTSSVITFNVLLHLAAFIKCGLMSPSTVIYFRIIDHRPRLVFGLELLFMVPDLFSIIVYRPRLIFWAMSGF